MTDSDWMQSKMRDVAVVAASWLAAGIFVWRLWSEGTGSFVLPLAGFAWMASPLVLTRLKTRPLLAASGVALLVLVSVLLLYGWLASMFLELLLGIDLFPTVLFEMSKVLPGVAVGVVVGIWVRRARCLDGSVE